MADYPAFELVRYPEPDKPQSVFFSGRPSTRVKVVHTLYDQDLTREQFLEAVVDFMRAVGYFISDTEVLDIYDEGEKVEEN